LLKANSSKGLLYIRFEYHIFKEYLEAVQNPRKKGIAKLLEIRYNSDK